eukprot:TRINITY_DN12337_c0_g1_i1.p2 TRINITY_DN12337_c0_g1~~TRINITY_DN12337_c0_g1_i1.p2  ORF type:complete len:123 (+),score=6.92 TRINITY_DN12337_c0_g1_i1:245-613(+)
MPHPPASLTETYVALIFSSNLFLTETSIVEKRLSSYSNNGISSSGFNSSSSVDCSSFLVECDRKMIDWAKDTCRPTAFEEVATFFGNLYAIERQVLLQPRALLPKVQRRSMVGKDSKLTGGR